MSLQSAMRAFKQEGLSQLSRSSSTVRAVTHLHKAWLNTLHLLSLMCLALETPSQSLPDTELHFQNHEQPFSGALSHHHSLIWKRIMNMSNSEQGFNTSLSFTWGFLPTCNWTDKCSFSGLFRWLFSPHLSPKNTLTSSHKAKCVRKKNKCVLN